MATIIATNSQNHPCVHCKLKCNNNGVINSLCCENCFNWYHLTCARHLNSKLSNSLSQKFRCNLCIQKTKCHTCGRKYFSRSKRVNCINCENSFCSKCAVKLDNTINYFLTPENDFYCKDCDDSFLCLKCDKPCEEGESSEPSILCDSCKKWSHFKCTKLQVRQFNKFGRTSESYYCSSCIKNNLPFCNISNKLFFDQQNMHTKTSNFNNCQLCIECNIECDVCPGDCPDQHRVCDNCLKCSLLDVNEFSNLINSKSDSELIVIHINVRSLSLNLIKIEEYIDSLDVYPDVICVSETKISADSDVNQLNIEGYSFVHIDSHISFGGTGIYVLNKYSYTN